MMACVGVAGEGMLTSVTPRRSSAPLRVVSRAGAVRRRVLVGGVVVHGGRRSSSSSSSRLRDSGKRRVTVTRAGARDDDDVSSSSGSSNVNANTGTSAARARLDAIRDEDERFVEDPGERGGFDMFSGGTFTPEVLANWESQNAFFFPRLLLFGATTLGLAASVPQSLGGVFRGNDDALFVLAANLGFFVVAAGLVALDVKNRKSALDRLQRELALGDMQVIQRDKFRNERVFPLQSLRQAARVAIVYGDAEKVARDLAAATPFRRRLEQSRILVVPVVERQSSAGGDAVADVGPGRWELLKDVVVAWPGAGAGRWLAWPTRNDAWAGYFRRLLASAGAAPSGGGYVTVGVNGMGNYEAHSSGCPFIRPRFYN